MDWGKELIVKSTLIVGGSVLLTVVLLNLRAPSRALHGCLVRRRVSRRGRR